MDIRIPDLESEHTPPNIEAYEKSMRVAGFVMWTTFTSLSIIGNATGQTDAFENSMLAAAGTGMVLLGEKMRHDRIRPYKQSLQHPEA